MSTSLPSGWIAARLGDITEPTRPRRNPQDSLSLPFVGMEQVESQTRKLLGTLEASEMKSTAFHFQPGDVLYGRLRPYLNKVLTATFEGLCSSEFIVLPVNQVIESKYLSYYLSNNEFVTFANQLNQGDRPRVSFDQISDHMLPLPPSAEQKRITTKLDLLLNKIGGCNERLKRIPAILKRFRQSVLAAACSGRLTADWREQHFAGDKNELLGNGFDSEFPETWRPTTLGELASFVTSGSRGWAKYYADTGSTFIRAQNINSDVLNLDDVAFVQLPNRTEGVRTKVHKNDILVTITGANVTKSALVDVDLEDAYISQHVALVRFHEPRSAAFLFLWIVSPSHGRRQLQDAAYGQGKPGLNLDNIRDVDVMIPPVDEQIEIVRRVESLFTLADQLEARYKKGKAYVDKLTQSILAKAFRGELVPQDPNDEPAEKLLERIREEKNGKQQRLSL